MLQEQLLVNCMAILPTWDKAISKLSVQTARTDNSEYLGLVRTSFTAKGQSLNLGTFFQKNFVARMAQNLVYTKCIHIFLYYKISAPQNLLSSALRVPKFTR